MTKKPPEARKNRMRGTIDEVSFEVGSDNIFADLGLPDAEEQLAKSTLASMISGIIENKGWDQRTAAMHLGTHQPVISEIRSGSLKSVTYDRLVGWLTMLGYSVTIEVKKARRPRTTVAVRGSI